MNVALYRNVDYINNKLSLHVGSALFNGFTFWMIGSSVASQQEVLFAIFNFIFVAPGVINQLQPLFVSILESPSMAANANNLFLDRETRHLRNAREEVKDVQLDRIRYWPHRFRDPVSDDLWCSVFR